MISCCHLQSLTVIPVSLLVLFSLKKHGPWVFCRGGEKCFSFVFVLRDARRWCGGDLSRSLSSEVAWRSPCCSICKSTSYRIISVKANISRDTRRKFCFRLSRWLVLKVHFFLLAPCIPQWAFFSAHPGDFLGAMTAVFWCKRKLTSKFYSNPLKHSSFVV